MAEKPEQQDALFVNLVLIFQNAAMQQMGKITNPVTGKIERNLEQARFSIDMIDMLRSKTRGNLSSDLEKLLDTTLTNLRMNYVDEVNKGDSGEDGAKGEGGAPEEEEADAGETGREKATGSDKGAPRQDTTGSAESPGGGGGPESDEGPGNRHSSEG